MVLYLLERQIVPASHVPTDEGPYHVCDSCRKRAYSILYTISESDSQICKQIDLHSFVEIFMRTLTYTS
jgi:hypothetical protein